MDILAAGGLDAVHAATVGVLLSILAAGLGDLPVASFDPMLVAGARLNALAARLGAHRMVAEWI